MQREVGIFGFLLASLLVGFLIISNVVGNNAYSECGGLQPEEIHGSQNCGALSFMPFAENDKMLEHTDFPGSFFGYTYFDFDVEGGISRVAFGIAINSIGEEYGFAIGWDIEVIIEHKGELHRAFFFAAGNSVSEVLPFVRWAERDDGEWEKRQELLVITTNLIPTSNVFLVHFDGQEIEILAMQPQRVSMPWE